MRTRLIWSFIKSAGLFLLLTAMAKLLSAAGSGRLLNVLDPIFLIPYRYLFVLLGFVELGIALLCLFGTQIKLQAANLAWLSTGFIVYRVLLVYVRYPQLCPCMGTLTDALHIPPGTADLVMKIVLGYIFVGSYITLYSLLRRRSETAKREWMAVAGSGSN